MRKILLAGVAGLGAWGMMAADASAQTAPMSQPATITTYTGGAATPKSAAPTPGTVVVRLNGRVRFYAYASWDHDASNTPNASPLGVNKTNNYGFAEYARLYPGFDGIAANGLKYGANLEIRQDTSAPAGGGVEGSISGQDPKRAQLYFRRVWGYLGTDQLGTIRVGAVDQPTSLYLTGTFENFNDGGWNGDAPGFTNGVTDLAWPFSDVGSYYTTNKVVYLSPSLLGFDLGVSFEPSTANVSGSVNCSVAAPGCDNLTSTPVNGETQRRRNTFDMLVRYRGSFGPVGVAATAAYVTGSHINDSSGLGFNNNPLATAGARYNYEGLSVGDFGATVTVAGLTVGGHYTTGRWNGYIGGLVPKGLPDGNAWVAGASYAVGPAIVGAQITGINDAGNLGNAYYGRDRHQFGVAVGGTYSVAPGVSLFLSGLYAARRQNGYDFISGAGVGSTVNGVRLGAEGASTHNRVQTTVISLGTAFSW